MAAAMGDLFAPAYIKSDPAAAQATQDWMDRTYSVSDPQIEQSRMPVSFNTGNPAGMVDPMALKAAAQGGPYDMSARRNAIAAQVQQQAQPAAQPAAQQQFPTGGYYASPEGQYFVWEQQQLAKNGPPQIQQPTYQESYGGGFGGGAGDGAP
jgi:hypothetical protein